MTPLIIGIGHKKLSGKDTLADLLYERLEHYNVVKLSFADELKEEAARKLGVSREEIEANKHVFRPFLQWYGTEYCKNYLNCPTYWVDIMWNRVTYFTKLGAKVVLIPDTRFLVEAEFIKKNGGVLIGISRPISRTDTHASECELDNYQGWDQIILNTGTLKDLAIEADNLLRWIKPLVTRNCLGL